MYIIYLFVFASKCKVLNNNFMSNYFHPQDDILPEITIRFGSECLVLDSWAIHHQYSALCVVMGPGMTNQLQENDFIRDIFGLGSKVNTMNGSAKVKASKLERVSSKLHNYWFSY